MRVFSFAGIASTALALTVATGAASETPDEGCNARLAALGVVFAAPEKLAPPPVPGCELNQPVTVRAIKGLPGSPDIALAGTPLLACAMAERLSAFLVDVAAPSAAQLFGSPPVQIDIGPGFTCRPRNNQPGAKISAHGLGLAADITSIRLANGRTLVMGKPADAQESEYADHLARRACVHFNTVLGIGSDATHMNNIHIDIEPRGPDGARKLCQ